MFRSSNVEYVYKLSMIPFWLYIFNLFKSFYGTASLSITVMIFFFLVAQVAV